MHHDHAHPSLVVSDLPSGDYLAICQIPVGTTLVDGELVEGDGPPHAEQGMVAEVTVP